MRTAGTTWDAVEKAVENRVCSITVAKALCSSRNPQAEVKSSIAYRHH